MNYNPFELANEMLQDRGDGILTMFRKSTEEYIRTILSDYPDLIIEWFGPYAETGNFMPETSGLYIFHDESRGFEIIYCGQSKNLKSRIAGHEVGGGYPVICITIEESLLNEAERLLIQHFTPRLNTHHNTSRVGDFSAFLAGVYTGRRLSEYAELPY